MMPAPFTSTPPPVPLPALYFYPLNDSFVPKHISLANNQRVKIGRQTNAKTVPAERNGYFDSKVLSRQHAEVWEEGGKIYIKDVKSSNGTFVNEVRLSSEGVESDPWELKTNDAVEFGIDIVGEDNKSIVHHKVAARVRCVFTDADAQAAARIEAQAQGSQNYMGGMNHPGPGGSGFNFTNGQGQDGPSQQRRPNLPPQGLVGMGGMGGNVRAPGRSGIALEHILSRLSSELQKSRDTGAELQSMGTVLNEVHETLGGNIPTTLPPFAQALPAVMPAQPQTSEAAQQQSAPETSFTISELHAQLQETQRALNSHVDRVRVLENALAGQEAIKQEVSSLRSAMEERKREMELFRIRSANATNGTQDHHDDDPDFSDDDDARSVSTVVPHELERVEEEDEDQVAAEEEEERRRRRDELGRPRTPEPTGMGMTEDDEEQESGRYQNAAGPSSTEARSMSPSPPAETTTSTPNIPDEFTERLNALAKQLEAALELSRSLEAQHAHAQSTIGVLTDKVASLEGLVQATQVRVEAQSETTEQLVQAAEAARSAPQAVPVPTAAIEEARVQERESLTSMFNEWKKNVEGRWTTVQEDWHEERERLRRAKEEWESRVRSAEETVTTASKKVDAGLLSLASFQAQQSPRPLNGKFASSGGLVTPPSPRSNSAESTRPRRRIRKAGASRGRTRSRSLSPDAISRSVEEHLAVNDDVDGSEASYPSRRSTWATDDSDSDSHVPPSERAAPSESEGGMQKMAYPITPESSVLNQPLTSIPRNMPGSMHDDPAHGPSKDMPQVYNLSTAVGVAVVAFATAAVVWRVRTDVSVS